jgi:hypothetical protein
MAWDALSNIFKNKQDEDGTKSVQSTYTPNSGTSTVSAMKAPGADASGWQGSGGSVGGPVSSKFVNFGTMYDLNKDKAGQQAKGLYAGAQGKAEAAKTQLGNAQAGFNQQATTGMGIGTATGQHPTRIGTYTETGPGSTRSTGAQSSASGGAGGAPLANKGSANAHLIPNWGPPTMVDADPQSINPVGGGGISITGSSLDQGVQATEKANADAAAQAAADAAKNRNGNWRYQQLFGNGTQLEGGVGDPRQNENVVSELDAKSGAGQQYTGPDSLKGMMGDEAYGALADSLRKGEDATQALTTEGGIAQALGYGPGMSQGNSALDTGLTETAGRANFKQLADRYKGLSGQLAAAQADSERAAAGGKIQAGANAKSWQDLLDEYGGAGEQNGKEKSPSGTNGSVKFKDDNGQKTRANQITEGGYGYTASDLQSAIDEGALSAEDLAFLNQQDIGSVPVVGGAMDWLQSTVAGNDNAQMLQNILAKLQKWKAGKK